MKMEKRGLRRNKPGAERHRHRLDFVADDLRPQSGDAELRQ
jgi:hypothetical protein